MCNMTKMPLQPGELDTESVENGVAVAEISVSVIKEQLAEIRDKVDKERVPLSKEMEEYTRENLRKVQDKLAKGEPIYPSDMEFIGKVKMWMEGARRNISPEQWEALMMLGGFYAKKKGEEIHWIDNECQFPGNKKIVVNSGLDLQGCTGLTVLPDNLNVGGSLDLGGCTGLTALPDNLHVAGYLNLDDCIGLTDLPGNLNVETDLYISIDAVEKIKSDAERLMRAGKIKGGLNYR